jgi:hypothetical protein
VGNDSCAIGIRLRDRQRFELSEGAWSASAVHLVLRRGMKAHRNLEKV